jgi:hypothetical protein
MDSKFIGAIALAAFAAVMWFAFIRRVPEETALGTIVSKGEMAGGTYVQQRVGQGGVPTTPNIMELAPAATFELMLDGRSEPVYASFNTGKGRGFEAGQRVQVQYTVRGIPMLWQRVTVTDMVRADSL